jgi:hypothetical protein
LREALPARAALRSASQTTVDNFAIMVFMMSGANRVLAPRAARWQRAAQVEPPRDTVLEICVQLTPMQSRWRYAVCSHDASGNATTWFDATTRRPLPAAWRVTHWRQI